MLPVRRRPLDPTDRGGSRYAHRLVARLSATVSGQPDFLKLWGGLTLSLFGMQVSAVALPLTAVVWLGATPGQMGVLGALRWLPYWLFGLYAGVWLDRLSRRRVLIVAHLGRALLLTTIPIAALADALRIEHLYLVAFATGVLMIFSDAAYQSMLPSVVPREHLVAGNSRFAASHSLAQILGPGVGGVLVQTVTAPIAVTLDAVSFLVDAVLVSRIRARERAPATRQERSSHWREIAEGLAWVFGSPLLRPIQAASMTFIWANAIWSAVFVLYLTRDLSIAPSTLGLLLAAGGPGAMLGSFAAGRVVSRFGPGPPIVVTQMLAGAATLLVPATTVLPTQAVPMLILAQFLFGSLVTIGSIGELSVRQSITPARLQGRMNATMRSLNWGTVAVGSLIGGTLGGSIGLGPTLLAGALLSTGASLWLVFSPVRTLRHLPGEEPSPTA